jgi:hypothetical protein
MTENNESKNSPSKKGLIIAFIAILLAVNAIQFFMNQNKTQTIEEQTHTIQHQEQDISGMMVKLDSVQTELTLKRAELVKLGAKVGELDLLLEQIQKDKDLLKKEKNYAVTNLETYKLKVEALMLQLTVSDTRISKLTAQRDSLFKFNQKLEKKIEESSDTIRSLAYAQKELEQKVTIASTLKASSIKIDGLTDRGKVKEGPVLKARHVNKLRVSFRLPTNEMAQVGGRDIYLRIMEPDGVALFNSSMEGGLFKTAEGKEIPYTMQQNILFENNNQGVSFTFLKGNAFRTGKHHAEVYCEGVKIGETTFTIE